MAAKRKDRHTFLIYAALACLTVVVFWGAHQYEFVNLDDPEYITGNQSIQLGFTAEAVKWAFTSGYAANWHPLTWFSHMLDFKLFGLDPGPHHVVGLLIHTINVLLLFLVLKGSTGAAWRSAFVACLFAIHPLHVESVAWVSERKDVLSTCFWLLTTLAYIRYCRRPRIDRYLPVFILFGLGLMAKPMLVTLPFALILMDYWPLDRILRNAGQTDKKAKPAEDAFPKYKTNFLIGEKIPLVVLTAASSVVTFVVQKRGGAMDIRDYYALPVRIGNALISYSVYMLKMLWPANLASFYPHPAENVSILAAVLAAALLLGITFLVLKFGQIYKYLPVGWFWYLGVLVPVIGLIQVGEQAYADRYTYIPLIGLFIIIAWGVPQLISKWPAKDVVLTAASLAAIAGLSVRAYSQQQYWRNSVLLFEHSIRVTENNYQAHLYLAEPLRKEGRFHEAIYHSEECLKIRPDNTEALNSKGLAMMDLGRVDEAIGCFRKAVELKPNHYPSYANLGIALIEKGRYDEAITIYRKILPNFDLPDVHGSLARALQRKGNKEEALVEYERLLSSDPLNASAHYSAGVLLAELGRNAEAVAHFRKALEIVPGSLEVHNSLGYVLAQQGQFDDAIQHYSEALQIAPAAAQIHINLGYVYVHQERLDLAAEEYAKALEIEPDNYVAHTYLGAVLFRLGKTRDALEHYNQALKINPDYAKAKNDLQSINSLLR
jgi:tetratricopeptide (TPR) repeat protein